MSISLFIVLNIEINLNEWHIHTGTSDSIVDFTASERDGCWDVLDTFNIAKNTDGMGPRYDLIGCSPYAFYPRTWSISLKKPETMNWK